nr:CHAD domain-containing protein [Thermoleophilaceae bacterium]
DTFDGRLHAAGLVLTHEGGRLVLADGAGYQRGSADEPVPPRTLFCADLPPGPLRELLEPIVEVRALTPIARVRSRLRLLRVLDDEAKTVVRLVVEEPSLASAAQAPSRLGPRVRVIPVRGYDEALGRVRRTLEHELGLIEAGDSLQDEAVAASGGIPGGVSSKLDVKLRPSERADRATATALAGPLAVITANLPGTLADVDSEFLHDLRVAVRRTRSLQRQLRSVFPPERLAHFRAEFRRLQQVTGPVRDLDVHEIEIAAYRSTLPADDLEPLSVVLATRRRAEFRRMARALRSKRTGELLADWSSLIEALPVAPEEGRPDAHAQIAGVAGARIRSVYRRMVKMGARIDSASPPEALHDLRKKGKELRYLLEFFAGIYPPEVVKPMVRRLKVLQDALGRYQDQEVQAGMLRSLRDEVGALDGGAAALMAMGLLVDGLEHDQAAAREEFPGRFAPFASKEQRSLVKETFR